jgi:hypothetical protein
MVLTSLITGDAAITAAFGLAGLIVLGGLAVNAALAKRKRDSRSPQADRSDATPGAHLSPGGDQDGRPLGDTPEAHDELSPHDLPVGHPGRPAAERQAGGEQGTTRGNPEGGAAGADERVGERR